VHVLELDHIVVNSTDIERALAWYCSELGLEGERVDDWRRGAVFFPSVRVNEHTIIDLFPSERTGENVNHFCLVIAPDDLDAIVERFPGAHRVDGLFGARGEASSVYVQDPDGNTVELRCYS
jgi:catechol 2,3-dioxygenase-like lactoylglutathione lyase family enzyme